MGYETILTDVVDGVLQITLHRPERLNAWTYAMSRELSDAVTRANDDEAVAAIVVTGAGRGFCAGADIEAVFQAQIDGEDVTGVEGPEDWVALVRRSKPMVAAINGPAVGIGLTQILPMDQLLASPSAKLSLRFVKLGIVPELASSHWVCRRLGFGKASELLLTGRNVDAEEALRIGLVDAVVPSEELLPAAHAMAHAMGDNPRASVRRIKELLTQNAAEADLERVQAREIEALMRCYASEEHREAVDAFLHKRAPDFAAARARERTR